MRIFISGGSKGIGLGIAKRFLGFGWQVAVCSRSGNSGLDGVLELICDVVDYADCERAFTEVVDKFGGIDVLVNNAGISHLAYFADMKPNEWQRILNTNLGGVLNLSHLAVRQMLSQGVGCIVNISSIWGDVGASCEAAYSAAKGGVDTFTRALAKEVASAGIRVNAVACGVIDTDMNDFLNDAERRELEGQIVLGRFGKVDEVAHAVEFLVNNQYINGQVIRIDGGMI